MEFAVSGFIAVEDQATVLGPLVIFEEHPSFGPVGTGEFLSHVKAAGKLGLIGDNEARSTVWLDDVDAVDRKLIEIGVSVVVLLCALERPYSAMPQKSQTSPCRSTRNPLSLKKEMNQNQSFLPNS